jgi:D-alanine-D-alanine ligase
VRRPGHRAELEAAVQMALGFDDLAIVEPYLDHPRELEISVLGNHRWDIEAFGPGEIKPGREFYDYVAKYRSDTSVITAKADLPDEVAADARAAAVEVFLAIGASGFARVDMLMSQDEVLFISEINTIPGFTPISLFPTLPAEGGRTFADVCVRIVELALERQAARPNTRLEAVDLPR